MKTTLELTITVSVSHDSEESLQKAIADLECEGVHLQRTSAYVDAQTKQSGSYRVESLKGGIVGILQ